MFSRFCRKLLVTQTRHLHEQIDNRSHPKAASNFNSIGKLSIEFLVMNGRIISEKKTLKGIER